MKLNIVNRPPKSTDNACLVIFLFSDGKLKGQARKVDADNNSLIQTLYKKGDFTGKSGQTVVLHGLNGQSDNRVLLAGMGERATCNLETWRGACIAAAKAVAATPSTSVVSDCLASISLNTLDAAQMSEHLTRELCSATYRFRLHPLSKPVSESPLEEIVLSCERSNIEAVRKSAEAGLATANGMSIARDLGNLAPNICTPGYLAERALQMASSFENFTTDIIDEEAMQAMGMGAFLSVSAGSTQPGKLIVMNYQGRKRAGSPVVLVGKGITFDTGGISIKSSQGLDEMKFDMCGAASVFGVMHALGSLQSPVNVVGLVAAAENMPDGSAARPGDVVTSMSGKTIEILNTDAEGRMVLCDALTYAHQFKPAAVIDVATLTGAAVTALGNHMSALFGNNPGIIDDITAAGLASGDPVWALPMGNDYQAQLDSNFADMANIGGRAAGAITAACFLSRFTEALNWAHLDIAGVAQVSGKDKGATGRPVPLLLKYLEQHTQ